MSPHGVLYGTAPSYIHLKVFDFLCHVSTLTQNGFKFASRAKKCVFIGYSFGTKGYKLFDLKKNSLFAPRDVILYENIFSFLLDPDSSSNPSKMVISNIIIDTMPTVSTV